MEFIKKINKKRRIRRANRMLKSRGVRRAKILYIYVILSAVFMLGYGVSTVWTGYPLFITWVPLALLALFLVLLIIKKNIRMVLVFIADSSRGRLLHVLNNTTEWSYGHKMKIIKWVYPRRAIRRELRAKLMNDVATGKVLDDDDKKLLKRKTVYAPQQLLDGFNKAILVNALIYADQNIEPLDQGIRDILKLTDKNISRFDFQREINKCKASANEAKLNEMRNIGLSKMKNKNGS